MIAGVRRIASRMRIQYASDLHLEFAENGPFQPLLKPVAPYLALAGDIGHPDKPTYRDFLHYCSRNWQDVFVVAGNHELYNSNAVISHTTRAASGELYNSRPSKLVTSADERIALCARVASEFPNVHFMDRQRVDRGGVAFLGCTLWTDLTGGDGTTAAAYMNDYRFITDAERNPVTPAMTSGWHFRDRNWLDAEINACEEEGRPAVVLTHHLPTFDLIASRYQGSSLNAAFASTSDDLIRPPVRAWICGHTHTGAHRSWQHDDGSVTLGVVNPRGYPGEGEGYSREIFVDISTEPGRGGDTRDPLLVASAAS